MTVGNNEILFGREGGVATVTLNRPQALNAFTLGMYRAFDPMLRAWAEDPSVHAVLVRGAGERAFCAGGDVRAIYEAGLGISGDFSLTNIFFREEYELIRRLHRYPKPYLAIIDGITMGGGAGVSINGAYRIATEKTMFAMPETGIGLLPDVGATRFLNLAPGCIGRYLGLTGARLGPADALYCGFATHYVPREHIAELVDSLFRTGWEPGREHQQVAELLAAFNSDPGEAPLAALRPAIDRNFSPNTIEGILQGLTDEGGEWTTQTHSSLLSKSPISLNVTLRQLITGRDYDIEGALTLEYRLTQHMMAAHDFYEGIRAVLVDKDQKPKWRPAFLSDVTGTMVDRYFASLGERELRF